MISLIAHQQIVIFAQSDHDVFEKARLKYQEIVELDERHRDNQLLELKFKKTLYYELWQSRGLLWGGVIGCILFGSFLGHNLLSQAVKCSHDLCEVMRVDGQAVRPISSGGKP